MKRLLIIACMLLVFFSSAVAQLTSGNVTIKLSGGDYSTWVAFWNDLGNLTGNITCTVDASEFTETAGPGLLTESLNGYTLKVTAATFPTTTDGSTGPRFVHNHTGDFFLGLEGAGELIIEGMVHKAGTGWGKCYEFDYIITGFTGIIRRCIIKGDGITSDAGITLDEENIPICKIYNNIIYDCYETAAGINVVKDLAEGSFISNNTICDSDGVVGAGFAGGDDVFLAENNLLHNNKTDFYNIDVNCVGNNNSSSDATADDWATGANNRINKIADPFTAYANDDFTLAVGSDPIGNGKNLSALFTDDFFGNTRSSWDIGAVEYDAGEPPAGIDIKVDTKDGAADLEKIDGVGVADINKVDGKP